MITVMRYKRFSHICILFISTLMLFSCDNMLDVKPLDKLSPDTYFHTEKELALFSDRFYYDILPSASAIYGESADEIIVNELPLEITGQRTIPGNGGGWDFAALRHINFMLENSSNCTDSVVRNRYDAVARFFRAYFYFEKVKRFGDIPWYDKVLDSNDPDLKKPRDSRQFVMTKVLEDIDFAINNLPTGKQVYRVTRWTALALKSRVCLFEGTFRKYHGIEGYETYLNECVSASDAFMTQSGYSLYNTGAAPYMDLFASQSAIGQEIILARGYSATLSLLHSVQNYETASSMGKPGLAKKIVNSYLKADGSRFTDVAGYETMGFFDECSNRDPRMSQTIRTPGYMRKGTTTKIAPDLKAASTGYQMVKYAAETVFDAYQQSANDMPVFRTAEVYLNFAEAKAELGNLTQEDINRSIKLIRDRARMPNLDMAAVNATPDPYLSAPVTGYPNVSGANKGVILEIRRERTIELIMEGFRYYDIIRWKEGKTFEQPMLGMYIPAPGTYDLDGNNKKDVCFWSGTKPSAFVSLFLEIGVDIDLTDNANGKGNILCHGDFTRKWNEERDYLYPVPVNERTLTGGALSQNPGWEDGLEFN